MDEFVTWLSGVGHRVWYAIEQLAGSQTTAQVAEGGGGLQQVDVGGGAVAHSATWLGGVGSWAWNASLSLGLVLNIVAVLAVVATRDRRLVDRWTSPWLAANLGLAAFGLGVPAVAWCLRTALSVLPSLSLLK